MAFLQLQGIGKIYVSEGNVTVGIRGVDLSFERGEFVAITGRSGSGKSTLLNVISGMDTYEEGELLIEGNPTSHYRQPEWEKYREKYTDAVSETMISGNLADMLFHFVGASSEVVCDGSSSLPFAAFSGVTISGK